jgi:signal transduction histidine kinase
MDDIFNVLNKYADLESAEDVKSMLKDIEKFKQEIDLSYAMKETSQLLENIKEGATRTVGIAKTVRVFSRKNESVMRKTDIHHEIDAALNLLQPQYKNKNIIIKEYGDIPAIECFPEKLNQVFTNIILNAIDAVKEQGEIRIKTERNGNKINISFKDNGAGISEENINKIFEPFFTTKPEDKGTGLGLAISFSIISKHNGSINVKSQVGQGAEFIITLPIVQSGIN